MDKLQTFETSESLIKSQKGIKMRPVQQFGDVMLSFIHNSVSTIMKQMLLEKTCLETDYELVWQEGAWLYLWVNKVIEGIRFSLYIFGKMFLEWLLFLKLGIYIMRFHINALKHASNIMEECYEFHLQISREILILVQIEK